MAKRARRRLRKQTPHDTTRFQIYVSSLTEASPVKPLQGIESYEINLLDDPPEADSSLNCSGSPASSTDAVVAGREQSPHLIEGNVLASPCPQLLGSMSGPHAVRGLFSTSQEGPAENSSSTSSDEISSNPTSYAARYDDICTEVDGEPCHISSVSSSCEDEHTVDLLHENGGATTSPYIVFEDDLSGPRNDENTEQQEKEGAEEAMSDLESQPENAWEPDFSSQSDVSDMRSEVEIEDEDEPISDLVESDAYSAKCFFGKNLGMHLWLRGGGRRKRNRMYQQQRAAGIWHAGYGRLLAWTCSTGLNRSRLASH
ncbi:hypothetical protein FPCIR_12786 [Fusarium pseudocircinatum]|uniref:Uncharacterized protein n=1 Tax=Fusarium pseudocircinatum TaxID=56676 RepID=A0A8H5KPH6_9HYPO|nr:hypothetical protein FPCIR_12786 [Fusarium pseudocircinatum]